MIAISETWYMFGLCVAIAFGAWFVFIWAVRTGQFKNTEQTARDMLDLDANEEALPDPAARPDGGDADESSGDPSVSLGGRTVESGRER